MNKRFSMLPGGGLYERYRWVQIRRATLRLQLAFIEIGRAAQEAVDTFVAAFGESARSNPR